MRLNFLKLTSLSVSVLCEGVLISVPNFLGLITRPLRLVFSVDSSAVFSNSGSVLAFLADLCVFASDLTTDFESPATSTAFRFPALGSAFPTSLVSLGVPILEDFGVSGLVDFPTSVLTALVSGLGVSVLVADFCNYK